MAAARRFQDNERASDLLAGIAGGGPVGRRPRAGGWVPRALDALADLAVRWEPVTATAGRAAYCLLCWDRVEPAAGRPAGRSSPHGFLCLRHYDEYVVRDGFHLRGGPAREPRP